MSRGKLRSTGWAIDPAHQLKADHAAYEHCESEPQLTRHPNGLLAIAWQRSPSSQANRLNDASLVWHLLRGLGYDVLSMSADARLGNSTSIIFKKRKEA
jgi:hypothetical protein